VSGFRFQGQRFDCGSKSGFLQATVAFGLARDDLREEFAAYLRSILAIRNAAE
jgi:UTP--glucose-1-phosphate uridylyltransferase